MRQWLIEVRPDDVEWKAPQDARELGETRIEQDQRNDALYQRLTASGNPLLAHLLYYHRREERPAWWSWFERRDRMTDQELINDNESIGGLERDETVPPVREKKSFIFTYRFPPQEHKFDPGDDAHDRKERAGEIFRIDDAKGIVELKRGQSLSKLPHPTALIPKPSVNSSVLREALQRFAAAVVDRGLDANPYRAATDILLGNAPRVVGTPLA